MHVKSDDIVKEVY